MDRRSSVTALARGLSILRCFDRPGADLTISEIARRTALSQPTAWRLCNTLLEAGFLVKVPGSAAVRIGAPALTLGYAAIKGQDLPAIARPYMAQATARLGATLTLSLRNGAEIMSVDQIDGSFVFPNQPVGWRASLASTTSGLAVLAVIPEPEREALLGTIEARDPRAWPRRKARIEMAAAQYAAAGYVIFDGMFDGQYSAAAVPLIEGSGADQRYWAISCGGLSTHWTDKSLEQAARELKHMHDLLQPAAWVIADAAG
jgi:DNA-binding IclR family transcriptional regulator